MRSLTVVPIQRRLAAAVLSAALAVGAVFPPAGFALVGEGDQEQEGTADPGAPAAPDTTADPDFDPGGEDVLPFDVGAPTDDGDDGAAVESEPVEDPDALAVPLDEPEDSSGVTDVAAPPLADAAPLAAPTPPAPAPPAAEATPQQPAEPQEVAPAEPSKGRDRAAMRQRQRERAKRRAPRPVVTIPAPVATPETVPVAAPSGPATTTAVETRTPRIDGGSRTYTVQQGDCLWTIAVALLGDELDGLTEADRNNQIQARVDRLYALNQDRIGSDPSVVREGIVLRLR